MKTRHQEGEKTMTIPVPELSSLKRTTFPSGRVGVARKTNPYLEHVKTAIDQGNVALEFTIKLPGLSKSELDKIKSEKDKQEELRKAFGKQLNTIKNYLRRAGNDIATLTNEKTGKPYEEDTISVNTTEIKNDGTVTIMFEPRGEKIRRKMDDDEISNFITQYNKMSDTNKKEAFENLSKTNQTLVMETLNRTKK